MVPISQILSKIYWNSNKSSGGTSGCNGAILLKIYNFRWNDIHSFSSLPYDRSKASSKASSPHIWNENQLMSQFYSYIAGSLHVSDTQTHLQESSYSCSHNHWFSICPLWTRPERTDTEPQKVSVSSCPITGRYIIENHNLCDLF